MIEKEFNDRIYTKNGRGHISHVRIQKKASGTSSSPGASIKTAATYSPTVTQYHRRDKA